MRLTGQGSTSSKTTVKYTPTRVTQGTPVKTPSIPRALSRDQAPAPKTVKYTPTQATQGTSSKAPSVPRALSRDQAPAPKSPQYTPSRDTQGTPPTPSRTVTVNVPNKTAAQYAQDLYGDASLGSALTKWFQSRGESGAFRLGTEVGVPSKADLVAFSQPTTNSTLLATSGYGQSALTNQNVTLATSGYGQIQNTNLAANPLMQYGQAGANGGDAAPFSSAGSRNRMNETGATAAPGKGKAVLNSLNPFEQQDILRRANIRSRFGGQDYVQSTPFSKIPQEQARLTDVQRQTDLAIKGGAITARDAQGNIVYQGNQQFIPRAPNKMSDSLRQFSGYSEYDLLNAGYLYDENTKWWYLPDQGTQSPGASDAGSSGGYSYSPGGYSSGGYGSGPFGGSADLINWRIGL